MDQTSVEQRLLVMYWAAAAHLLCVTTRSPSDIDRAATHIAGFTKGPFETMKEVRWEVEDCDKLAGEERGENSMKN